MDDMFTYPAKYGTQGPYWVGDPRTDSPSAEERLLIDKQDSIVIWGYAEDVELSYEFDEMALVSLDGVFYLVQANGCSCPSPAETWHVEWSGDLDTLWRKVVKGEYTGYTLPFWAMNEITRAFEMARSMTT